MARTKKSILLIFIWSLAIDCCFAQDSLTVKPIIYMSSYPDNDSHVTTLVDRKPLILYYFIGGELNGLRTKIEVKNTASKVKVQSDTIINNLKYSRILILPIRSKKSGSTGAINHEVEILISINEPERYLYVPSALNQEKPLYNGRTFIRSNALWQKESLANFYVGTMKYFIRPKHKNE